GASMTLVGAEVGIPLILAGSIFSGVGIIYDASLDYREGDTSLARYKVITLGLTSFGTPLLSKGMGKLFPMDEAGTRVNDVFTNVYVDFISGNALEEREGKK